jgi:hypothetical protein
MALEGGVPALYAPVFAMMQIRHLLGVTDARWQQAIDDAGRLLDAWGDEAERLGWRPADLFDASGLIWDLNGRAVIALAGCSSGRVGTDAASRDESSRATTRAGSLGAPDELLLLKSPRFLLDLLSSKIKGLRQARGTVAMASETECLN